LAIHEVVILSPWPEHTDPCFHLYPLRLGARCRITRDQLFEGLQERGIRCQVHYIPIYQQPFYQERYQYDVDRFPQTEDYFANCISLPLFPSMDENMLQYVINVLLSLLGSDAAEHE
jgi:dTDP-4-amino-4,6-dideoxygalactose transaminase